MYEIVRYEGGVYRNNILKEWIEDVGGFVIQEHVMQLDVYMTVAIPRSELENFKREAKKYKGKVVETPLAGIEIAVVAPSLSRHHLPHTACDIAEYLRRYGAKSNMIGLAHGAGKDISSIKEREKRLIEEHDLAVYVMGNFESCIKDKVHLFEVDIPVVVTGGPEKIDIPYPYVGNLGRRAHRLRHSEERQALKKMVEEITKLIIKRKEELSYDPPVVPPVVLKDILEKNVEEIYSILSPMPIVTQLDGLRVKLDYDTYHDKIETVKVGKYLLKDIAEVKRSHMKNYILIKIKPTSEVIG
ncbi:MAG TPA: methanogenesis marker 7 protein [Methanothermococcus okinawensis]|uniref:Methanogenesis marker 7 protein n=1 Tax=Methanothermococcus okinawensis TaxID=155863 RepID=A0A833E1M8_9EURY|nr:methanogenesis marker 7 protein [Methanococcaceae archaeon]HIP84382.1 methanogenesis marker 7 protein [Methanothermococcus okinawensis]HIP91120.1 methanogenesis marker 7 protein [Methanothermococcus okinawensis]